VASRAEVLPFRDRAVPPRTLARELAVDYVVHGSVRRAGQRARISAQLVRASDGHTMWAERFDRTLDDLFQVQAEVSRSIVDALQVALRPGEREMLDRVPTKNREAYAHYVHARTLLNEESRDANFRAVEFLQAALALDPEFALAHAALGEAYAVRGLRWWGGLESADLALECAERALALAPGQLEAEFVRAMVFRLKGDHPALLEAVGRVLSLDPTHLEALEFLGWSYLAMNRPADAEPVLIKLTQVVPERYRPYGWLGQTYDMLGRPADARRAFQLEREKIEEHLARHPADVYARTLFAANLIHFGDVSAGLAQAERSVLAAPDDGRIRYNVACAFARAGELERAIHELEEGVRRVPSYISDWPVRDPDMASLWSHPKFIRMFGTAANPGAHAPGATAKSERPASESGAVAPAGGATPRVFQADHDV
jgi:adenylate cyclase